MKYINIIILLIFVTAFGFQSNNVAVPTNIKQSTFAPKLKTKTKVAERILMDNNFEEIDKSQYKGQIQINPAPFPFNITHPYVVWVDGAKVNLSLRETKALAKALDLPLEAPKDTAELHAGSGWLQPLNIKANVELSNN